MLDIRTILHPTGLYAHNRAAFRAAQAMARKHCARLVVLHVMRPWYRHGRASMRADYILDKIARGHDLARLWTDDATPSQEHRLGEGNPVDIILHHARAVGCDLIVMGYEPPAGLIRLLKPSVTEAVLRRSPCPVLVVGSASRARRKDRRRRENQVSEESQASESVRTTVPVPRVTWFRPRRAARRETAPESSSIAASIP